jgi:hypothetical protein
MEIFFILFFVFVAVIILATFRTETRHGRKPRRNLRSSIPADNGTDWMSGTSDDAGSSGHHGHHHGSHDGGGHHGGGDFGGGGFDGGGGFGGDGGGGGGDGGGGSH